MAGAAASQAARPWEADIAYAKVNKEKPMTHPIIREIEKSQLKAKRPDFKVGDTVEVRTKVVEGDKERIQSFIGAVIARRGAGPREVFVVRRIVQGEGVERVFPLHSPNVVDVRVRRRGEVRRAKLYYLRDRVGKATRIKGRVVHQAAQTRAKAPPADAEATEENGAE